MPSRYLKISHNLASDLDVVVRINRDGVAF